MNHSEIKEILKNEEPAKLIVLGSAAILVVLISIIACASKKIPDYL